MRRVVLFLAAWVLATPAFATAAVTLNCGLYSITLSDGFTWFVPRRRAR